MKYNTIFLFFFTLTFLSAQNNYRGIVLDSLSGEPMKYANFIWENGHGAITNEEGGYEFFVKTNDSLLITISYIGYHDLQLNLRELNDTIYLSPKAYELDEVVVIDTDDLKKKILVNFNKNYELNSSCVEFFYKQFLKENDKYVNYLESIGVVKKLVDIEGQELYIKGVRKTENLITSYVNFRFQSISRLFDRISKNILKDGEITDYDWIAEKLIEVTVKDYETEKDYLLTIDTSDYSIQKVIKSDLTEGFNKKIFSKTMYINNKRHEVDGFLQGEFFEYDFKKVKGKYFLNHIYHKGKGILLSKDKTVKHQFISEQLYLTTNISSSCNPKKNYSQLKRGRDLRDINAKLDQEQWSKLNAILPLKEQLEIISTLGKVE